MKLQWLKKVGWLTMWDVCTIDWPKEDAANFESQNFEGPKPNLNIEKKNFKFFFSINFTQIFRICPKMLQFLTYLLYKQIIEMRRSQNLRRPLSVPCPTQCYSQIIFTLGIMGSMWDKSVWSVQIRSDILKGMQKIFCNLKFW